MFCERVFVVCPADVVTGGPELCHQLVDTLNRAEPGRASILYHPFGMRHRVPQAYRRYDVAPAGVEEIRPGAVVVLPEVYGYLVGDFPDCRVHFWWMSVNNFHRAAGGTASEELAEIRRHVDMHLCQSEYARLFLESVGLGPAQRLSDYLADDYIRAIKKPPRRDRLDVVVFNPAKGWARTERVLLALGKGLTQPPDVFPLKRLNREQVMRALSRAKVYIDFGEHPGKDRLPREAAALGCCVLTNRRGSAANTVDVPIPEEFKVDDRRSGFERRAATKIRSLIDDFDAQSARFDGFRAMIAAEPAQFAADVDTLFTRERVEV